MQSYEAWTLAFSMASIVIAAIALHRTSKFNHRQTEFFKNQDALNKRLLKKADDEARDVKRAVLHGSIIKGVKGAYHARIYNTGSATARNVQVEVTEGERYFSKYDLQSKLPLAALGPHQNIELGISAEMGSPSRYALKVRWEDDHQTHNVEEIWLTT